VTNITGNENGPKIANSGQFVILKLKKDSSVSQVVFGKKGLVFSVSQSLFLFDGFYFFTCFQIFRKKSDDKPSFHEIRCFLKDHE
jgi:hypothetical protein